MSLYNYKIGEKVFFIDKKGHFLLKKWGTIYPMCPSPQFCNPCLPRASYPSPIHKDMKLRSLQGIWIVLWVKYWLRLLSIHTLLFFCHFVFCMKIYYIFPDTKYGKQSILPKRFTFGDSENQFSIFQEKHDHNISVIKYQK